MIRVYADFNNMDEHDRVRLNTVGSMKDLELHKEVLREGMRVLFYVPGDFEVEGNLVFDVIWRGIPDWTTIRYLAST
jgi:hypothetical protein